MKLFLSLILMIILSCSAPKNIILNNKKSLGLVETVSYVKSRGIRSTFVQTELDSFFIDEKVKIKEGTEIFIYSNSIGTKIYVTWSGSRCGYKIR